MRHGPHQAAQKSTSTGTLLSRMISSNSAALTSTGSAIGGRGDLHAPHLPVSAMWFDGTRFGFPQDGQFRTIAMDCSSFGVRRMDIIAGKATADPSTSLGMTAAGAVVGVFPHAAGKF